MSMIRTTCPACSVTADVRVDRLVLDLPCPDADAAAEPQLVHGCSSCSATGSTAVSWRTAAYLVHSGATTVVAPDDDEVRPRYPERRPATDTPMTLDDLIALHAALDAPVAAPARGR